MLWDIYHFPSVSSTQNQLKTLLLSGAQEHTVVHADFQEVGRGRHGREWLSEEGNLFCSTLLKPDIPLQGIGQLSFVAVLAVLETVRVFVDKPDRVHLKWPNDVLIDGLKCAGILLEVEEGAVLLGVGVNVVSAPLPDISTSIAAHSVPAPSSRGVLTTFLKSLETFYTLWQSEGFPSIRDAWLKDAHTEGDVLRVNQAQGQIEGRFAGLDANGCLLLKTNDDTVIAISSGDVYL